MGMSTDGNDDDPRVRAQADSTRANIDSTRAGTDSTRALVDSGQAGDDSTRAQTDSDRAQADSDRKERQSLQRIGAYLLLAAATALGIWRVEDIANEAHDTAVDFADSEEREDAEEADEAVRNCQLRNTATRNARQGDSRIIDAFEQAFLVGADTPKEIANVKERAQEAREYVLEGRSAEVEDRDCNLDGTLNEGDYLP